MDAIHRHLRLLEPNLQNWQSEFLAGGSMAVLSIYLRQRGSREPKPVGARTAGPPPKGEGARTQRRVGLATTLGLHDRTPVTSDDRQTPARGGPPAAEQRSTGG
jgi:hypothetical protein